MINYLKILVRQHVVKYLAFYLLSLCFCSPFRLSAQNDTTGVIETKKEMPGQNISLFSSNEILNIFLYMDLGSFLKKTAENDTFEGEIVIIQGATDTIKKKVRLRYRGILRKELCSFPPIEVKFRKSLNCDSGKIKKLKLVTHCEPGSNTDEYVLREYLVYKLFNALTDTSLKVRLLKVSDIYTKRNKKTIIKYGIFIEPVEMLAKRTNSMIVKSTTLNQNHIIPHIMDRLAIFNYMVANWDWSIPGQHNVKILTPLNTTTGSLGIAVPYDFDLTGIVNAEYAIPPPNVPIENIRQRLFWGLCRSKEVYMEDLREFSDHKEAVYSVINDCPYLSKGSKKDITYFMDGFFDQLEKPRSMDNLLDEFLKTCKY
jgi:hypothetical protein